MIPILLSVGFVISALLMVRRRLIAAKVAEETCKELVADLARSERERKIVIKAFVDACAELDRMHDEKRGSWGIPDKM